MPALQPFDRHPADPGSLAQQSAALTDQAARVVDASRLSLQAFLPAIQNWDGIASAELRAAPRPVREKAYAVSSSLSWAATALRFWSARVAAFNRRVDQIRAGLDGGRQAIATATGPDGEPADDADKAQALQALEARARNLWWLAYNADIVAGASTAAGMLTDGPTPGNVAAARSVGLIPPGQPWNPLGPVQTSLNGFDPFEIPFPLVPLTDCPLDDDDLRRMVDGATDGAALANAMQLPFKEGLLQMLGGEVGDVGVDAANDNLGTCTTPIDLPQPPPPPPPPPAKPGFFEDLWNDVEQTAEDFVDQLPDPTNPDTWPRPFPDAPPLPPPMPIPAP